MSLKSKYDRAEQLTDDALDLVRKSRYSAAIVAIVFLIILSLYLIK